jgi:PBS lyase HEAT-like repeat-containing protein
MIKKHQNKSATPSKTDRTGEKKSLLKKEWPLLLYPALALLALSVLYTANRSLQNELSHAGDPCGTGQSTASGAAGRDARNPRLGGGESVSTTPSSIPSDTGTMAANQATQDPNHPGAQAPSSSNAIAGAAGSQDVPTVATLLGTLRQALQRQDHAQIKQCMNDLVALGDGAVLELGEIIASSTDETALWAAEALARIGTPAAATALLDTLEQIKDGPYKEQLAKRASNISNHDSWPLLLDAVQASDDPTVQRAAATSLGRIADTAVVDEIVARYDAALTPEEAELLARTVGNISSPEASASLRSLAGSVSSAPQDSLQRAAIDAMASIGDPQSVSYLLQKLEASSPGEGGYLFNTITTIDQPQAQSALLYAAAGSKEVSAEQGQTAAICALQNYPSEETYRLLEQIAATTDNTAVATAALRTLENIDQKQPAVAESTTSKADTTTMLPVDPLKK